MDAAWRHPGAILDRSKLLFGGRCQAQNFPVSSLPLVPLVLYSWCLSTHMTAMFAILPLRCCGVVSLRTGTLLIAGSHLTASIVFIAVCSVIMNTMNEVAEEMERSGYPVDKADYTRTYSEFAFILSWSVIMGVVLNIIMIFGIDRNNPKLMLPYIWACPFSVAFHFIRFIVFLFTGSVIFWMIILDLFMQGLYIYFFLVIYGYYLEATAPAEEHTTEIPISPL